MSISSDELANLIAQAGKIQQATVIRLTDVNSSPGAFVLSGDGNTVTYTYRQESIDQEFVGDINGILSNLRKKVDEHKHELPEVDEVLANIDKVERELKKEKPDAPTILGRIREVAQAVAGIVTLTNLAAQVLSRVTSIFQIT